MSMRPALFISTVSKELKTSRQLIANSLHLMGYEATWQDIFGTEQGDLRAMLRKKIDDSHGVVQLVGAAYGAEPREPDPQFGRVSYTQYEALYAKSRGKKVWYLFTSDGFPTDPCAAEPEELRQLQEKYRKAVRSSSNLYYSLDSHKALEAAVLKLRDDLDKLRRNFRRWAAAVIVLLLLLLAGGFWLNHQLAHQRQEVVKESKELSQMHQEQQQVQEQVQTIAELMTRFAPPAPTGEAVAPAAIPKASQYAPSAYAGLAIPPKPGQFLHPQVALSVFGLAKNGTDWEPLEAESSLRTGDHISVRADTFTPGYLYIFNVDATGVLHWLYPSNSTFSDSGVNPLPSGAGVILPPEPDMAYPLDDHTGVERIYAIYSATRWLDLEKQLQILGENTNQAALQAIEALVQSDSQLAVRGKGISRPEHVTVAHEVSKAPGDGSPALPFKLPSESQVSSSYWIMEVKRFQHLPAADAGRR